MTQFTKNPMQLAVLKANDCITRDRYDKTTVQTSGKVYVSNKLKPSEAFSDTTSWVEITPATFTNFFVLDFPFTWLGVTDTAYVKSSSAADDYT